MVSFLKKENNSERIAKSDIIFIIVLIVGSVGGYLYWTNTRDAAFNLFTECGEYYDSKNWNQALDCYAKTYDLQWRSDSLDTILYEREPRLLEMKEEETLLFDTVSVLVEQKDYKKAQKFIDELKTPVFLPQAQKEEIILYKKQIFEALKPDSAQVSKDSSAESD
jgi:hypothetical protein